MFRWTDVAFCAIWAVVAVVSFALAKEAWQEEQTSLDRFSHQIPPGYDVRMDSVSFQAIINELADVHNANAAKLETSIRQSAATTFTINVISFCAALLGLLAQSSQTYNHYRKWRKSYGATRKQKGNPKPNLAGKDASPPTQKYTPQCKQETTES
jgi:hypothetical protein